VIEPKVGRGVCQDFLQGKCNRGEQCNFSHERGEFKDATNSNAPNILDQDTTEKVEQLLKDFRWKVPKQTAKIKPLGFRLGIFFQQALELVRGDAATTQEVITLLASESFTGSMSFSTNPSAPSLRCNLA
jgi:hypothetical protein